ncbi:glycoside hydrolase family 16 protein [Sphingomonas qomolangmaensis]|uniref:Glycoside hydrolase family 16 protein n=1 Tax=Sphingomonas qomolangmaensis TaxID=2918765 RepID=A0ABY5LC90_9SPHN|nr:glycoside hydrolase family 16 protein [Sphingomonas qomolangmaensis]UUL84037.1 glycoside hydrolase family 16 protein [Sphingomonas qomolangmaensis]
MFWFAIALQAATLGATNYAADAPMAAPKTPPTLADEFAVTTIDPSVWRYDTHRNAEGWHNNELQYYSAGRRENARVENGVLIIEARREPMSKAMFADWGGQHYSSAKLVTNAPLGYGFYQIRAKLPCERGGWPAIWMLPEGGTWPDMGEIDIMEMVGWDAKVVHATLHSGSFNHAKGTQRGAQKRIENACTTFHDYQLDWKPDSITIGVDGRSYMRVTNDTPGDPGAWPFDRPYHLILNLAVGGDWGGKHGVDDSALPMQLAIDHVRYWKTG